RDDRGDRVDAGDERRRMRAAVGLVDRPADITFAWPELIVLTDGNDSRRRILADSLQRLLRHRLLHVRIRPAHLPAVGIALAAAQAVPLGMILEVLARRKQLIGRVTPPQDVIMPAPIFRDP